MGYAASSFSSAFSSTFGPGTVPWLAPLRGWLRRRPAERKPGARLSVVAASHAPAPQTSPSHAVARRPLRVLRVVDGTSRHYAGRMVISGSMADVCAELDRLAAREALRATEPRGIGN